MRILDVLVMQLSSAHRVTRAVVLTAKSPSLLARRGTFPRSLQCDDCLSRLTASQMVPTTDYPEDCLRLIFTARSELREVLFLALTDFFVFVCL